MRSQIFKKFIHACVAGLRLLAVMLIIAFIWLMFELCTISFTEYDRIKEFYELYNFNNPDLYFLPIVVFMVGFLGDICKLPILKLSDQICENINNWINSKYKNKFLFNDDITKTTISQDINTQTQPKLNELSKTNYINEQKIEKNINEENKNILSNKPFDIRSECNNEKRD